MGVRDSHGAARYLDHGNLPFGNEILEFHREKIAVREKEINRKVDYEVLINDITAIANGSLLPDPGKIEKGLYRRSK